MSRYGYFHSEESDSIPSFKGNLVRRFIDPHDQELAEDFNADTRNVLWHWNPLIGKSEDSTS